METYTMEKQSSQPSREQIIYANLLLIGVFAGIIIMITTYGIYLTGLLPAHVDLQTISKVWGKGVDDYLKITHSPHGWGWLAMLGKGDFLNYVGFILLGLMTVICYLVLLRGFLRQKNRIFTVISFLEIAVLLLAASGILVGGGH